MEKRDSEVKDLVEELRKGKMTRDDVLEEIERRGLSHHAGEPIPGVFSPIGVMVWALLCFLPAVCAALDLHVLDVPRIEMPTALIYAAIFLALVSLLPSFYSAHLHEKRSVTGDEDIVLVRTGAYGVVRHPAFLGGLILILAFPIIFAVALPFTVLSVLGELAAITGVYLQAFHEERINLRKWGDEYRQYMEEVPRFNFVTGLWRLRRRRL